MSSKLREHMAEGAKWIVVFAGVALLFSWFGVYGTSAMPFAPRFGLWFMTMVVGGISWAVAMPWVEGLNQGRLAEPVKVILLAAIVSLPITFALQFVSQSIFSPYYLALQYGYVLVVSLVIGFASWLIDKASAKPESAALAIDPAVQFLERLPVKYRTAALFAVSAEDHYLRVHTSMGEELILMRFSDAMRELDGANGLQTHRSWWVANEGVADIEKQDGKQVLILKSGGLASVSRTYASAVKAAGLS